MMNALQKLKDAQEEHPGGMGDLDFVKTWEFFASGKQHPQISCLSVLTLVPDPKAEFEQLTRTGPFSGTLGAFTNGVKLRTRYQHLLPSPARKRKLNFWASDSARVIDTARYFGAGFFGLDWKDRAQLHVIPETADRGANTLTPGDTCLAYLTDDVEGHDKGARMLGAFRATYLDAPRQRLAAAKPRLRNLTDDELYAMQEMCGFEITVRGSSSWCDVFTRDEWLAFEYARDVLHYYRAGPGTPYGAVMGWLWLEATARLLGEGPRAGPFFFSL